MAVKVSKPTGSIVAKIGFVVAGISLLAGIRVACEVELLVLPLPEVCCPNVSGFER